MGIEQTAIRCGTLPHGARNKISDVAGVTVGHTTLCGERTRTGVTVVLPGGDNLFLNKRIAAAYVHNGFGKTLGTVQLQELGTLETPIALTNTLNVGLVHDALVGYTLDRCAADGTPCFSVNPVVGECNDCTLNDIARRAVRAEHVRHALETASADFEEGGVGAGAGTLCYGLKGGIGSASRLIEIGGERFTVGVLVQSNFGRTADLVIDGRRVGEEILRRTAEAPFTPAQTDKGSIITVLATDLPVSSRQLFRILRRTGVGLAQTGSFMGHGSGEVMLGFSTANVPAGAEPFVHCRFVRDELLNDAFRAAAEAAEEAVLSSMLHAESAAAPDGTVYPSLADFDLF
ncbi:MAG: P1 family peptidase [Hominenteromicrobium sp.]